MRNFFSWRNKFSPNGPDFGEKDEQKKAGYSEKTGNINNLERILFFTPRILRIKGKFTNIFKVMVRISVYPRGATRILKPKEKLPQMAGRPPAPNRLDNLAIIS